MKYRKKPIIIDAFQFDGDLRGVNGYYVPDWAEKAANDGILYFGSTMSGPPCDLFVKTLEGNMLCNVGDFLIKGVNGEIYPCKADIFKKSYEIVEE